MAIVTGAGSGLGRASALALAAGGATVLIEDVSTTGRQVQRAAEALQQAGVTITRIVLAIDRGGGDHLRAAGYDVEAVAVLRPED